MARFGWDDDVVDGLRVPGVYGLLLENERRKCSRPDPREVLYDGPGDGKVFRRSTRHLKLLEAGEPVELPKWMLGGWSVPDERVRRLAREDRTITGWVVAPDDSVTPIRGGE